MKSKEKVIAKVECVLVRSLLSNDPYLAKKSFQERVECLLHIVSAPIISFFLQTFL